MRKITNQELGRLSAKEFKVADKIPVIIVLDNVRSALNVGSVFRTADAFLIKAIYLCGITATPPARDIKKTALGASETVQWKYFDSTKLALDFLQSEKTICLAIEQAEGSTLLQDFEPIKENKYALVFGHEVQGVSQEAMEKVNGCIEIPQSGTKHSLNISVSAGIVAWHFYRFYQNQS